MCNGDDKSPIHTHNLFVPLLSSISLRSPVPVPGCIAVLAPKHLTQTLYL